MAKSFLQDYKIAGDLIDRIGDAPASPHNSGGEPPESPPVGGTLPQQASAPAPSEPAETMEEQPKESSVDGLKCARDGLFQVFTIGGTSYRLGGVKSLFVTSLRVNIRASNGTQSYYDGLDLYAARARSSFAAALNRTWGADCARVEKDLVLILEYLEAERDAALRSGGEKREISLSQGEKEAGLELLRDGTLFERIVDDLSALGYVGEDLNKQLLYLCASSRKLDDPISVLILSQSASGKSFLVDTVKRLMPEEEVVSVTSLSDQALNYIEDLSHKFLVLGEAVHGEVVEHQIREMLSGKELSRLVTVKDVETGKMQSRVVKKPVIVASVMSGTNHGINPENSSRCFVINADESREQTTRIHERQRQKYSLERLKAGRETEGRILARHRAAQRLLTKRNIVNEFAPLLDFPVNLMRLRRDHDRFLDLIACVCFLRQYQKKEEWEGAVSFIRCDPEDYRVAYRIMVEGVLSSTMRELPAGAQLLYEELRLLAKREAKKQGVAVTEVTLTQRQLREAAGLAQTWVRENLRLLVDYEYVTLARGGSERSKGFYRLKEDAALAQVDLSMIPTVEEMAAKLGRRK
ncbi:hypothetical protein MASR2M78_22430 [Treponema sp.]